MYNKASFDDIQRAKCYKTRTARSDVRKYEWADEQELNKKGHLDNNEIHPWERFFVKRKNNFCVKLTMCFGDIVDQFTRVEMLCLLLRDRYI